MADDDKRVRWIEARVYSALKPKKSSDIFDELGARAVTDFLDISENQNLFVFFSGTTLTARTEAPSELKKKGIFFAKLKRERITDDFKNIIFGDLHPESLSGLNVLAKDIFANLISRDRANTKQISDVDVPDLVDTTNQFLSNVLVTQGLCEGRTLLPLPPVKLPSRVDDAATKDKDLLYFLETSIVEWSGQIRAAMLSSPEEMMEASKVTHVHPGPLDEIEFWRNKSENLANLEEQIHSVKILKILVILKKAGSQYYASFAPLMAELSECAKEARDNYRFLRPLRSEFEAIQPRTSVDFNELANSGVFRRLFHFVYLLWTQSNYYNTPARLVILIREMCNDLIECARENVSVSELEGLEKKDAIQRLSSTLSICGHFKAAYFMYKSRVAKESRPWKFQNTALFSRLDAFLERCHDLLDVMETALLFDKMESMKIGGTGGSEMTTQAERVKQEFDAAQAKFLHVEYDLLDVDEPQFDVDFGAFRGLVRDLERKMGSLLTECLDDAKAIDTVFKAVDTFDGFTDRAIVAQEWDKRQLSVLKAYHEDLLQVQEIVTASSEKLGDAYSHMPPTTTTLVWARALLDRIGEPYSRIQELSKPILESELGVETSRLYKSLNEQLKSKINHTYEQWSSQVGQISTEKLKMPLIARDSNGNLEVNFDPSLVKTLSEVYYLDVLNSFENGDEGAFTVPQQAHALFANRDTFRSQVLKLDYISTTYNSLSASLREDEEKPLLRQELEQFDAEMQKGERDIHWSNAQVIDDFVEHSLKSVDAINAVVETMHGNLQTIQSSINEFIREDKMLPLNRARGDKTMTENDFRKKLDENTKNRCKILTAKGKEIHELIDATFKKINELKASTGFPQLTVESDAWVRYVEYVNGVVRDLLCESIVSSLRHVHHQLDTKWIDENDSMPLLEIRLSLTRPKENSGERPEARFDPHLSNRDGVQSVDGLINEVIGNITNTASFVSRLDSTDQGDNYVADVREHNEANRLIKEINDMLHSNADGCQRYLSTFDEFKPLWEKDMKKSFQEFLSKDGDKRPAAIDDQGARKAEEGGEYFGVPLSDYNKAITDYERIGAQIDTIEDRHTEGFLRIDVKPIRHALQDVCRRWKETYSGHLMRKIEDDLVGLRDFVEEADEGLEAEVLDGNIESLKSVMRWIRDCRKRNVAIMGVENTRNVGMFPPIQAAILMLKSHLHSDSNFEASSAKLEALEELRKPAAETWNTLNKKALNVRALNSLVQDREAEKVKEQQVLFEEELSEIARRFHAKPFFGFNVDVSDVYNQIDAQNRDFAEVEAQGRELQNLQELFDLTPSEFKELRECKQELVMLKHLWDLVVHVNMQFQDWMSSPFKSVDTGAFETEARNLGKQLKAQHIKVRGWDCFKGLEEQVRNVTTSLPLCGQLGTDAMRDRHWAQLMATTNQSGRIDPQSDDFTLENLLSLGLHKHADEVALIVEKAEKEKAIERQLAKIIEAWEKMTYTYEHRENLGTHMLGATDAVVEQLEIDNATLSSMLSNRFVEYFFDSVMKWQKNLGLVDSCTIKWSEIQRQWISLYPIFILSADIKEQLPEDAKNFQEADDLFRAFMSKAKNYSLVIEVICSDAIKNDLGRGQDLEEVLNYIQDILDRCQKSLTDYLETKRLIFPRFYFVSEPALIDILSKGSDPKAVMLQMSKIVDSIEAFKIDDNKNPQAGPKDAWAILSVQGEEVLLPQDFRCDGPVEVWLNGAIDAMHKAIKYHIQEANSTYIEKPRTEWIYSYCCQAVIVASRIWFTTEVHQAFTQIEEGNDMGMKDLLRNQKTQLDNLIKEVLGDRTKNDRTMLVQLITIDVHNRDIVQNMVDEKTDTVDAFIWQSQLRYYWDDKKGSEIRICDADFINGYEYVGVVDCLVITKLTDRCYITLSQALRLKKGGAPAGPAGTGKTETTKDLARCLGIACYVFNCSDQMNYMSLGRIFKGLAMSGSWGCFDEFNRISIEVLSVVATQVGSILNALKENKKRFRFMEEPEEIPIIHSVGSWITMNPGYAGRTELPENIKALFRPCAMVVPDLKNICEIRLAAEGFGDAKDLALKFVTLYNLNRELLSPQRHYDWGLRAIKSVLYIAGSLKRGDPTTSEREVLMRALRDTNMAKLSKDDVYVFMGLIRCLFPNLDVPKKEDLELQKACEAVCAEMKNLPGDKNIFITRCLQYEELLHVRHSVFILGAAGCGKTQCWKCLQGAITKLNIDKWKARAVASCLNPKAISSNELYGYFTPAKEWRDGILSNIFRDYAAESKKRDNSKWIVLDGIIDAEWIESMNTVMDDNKMLTLVSNERITLSSSMRMIFEISHLINASPATVTRAGVVFINETDLGWAPLKDKWVAGWGSGPADEKERALLDNLFDKYVPTVFEQYKTNTKMRPVVSVMDISIVQTLCHLIEGILNHNTRWKQQPNWQEVVEKYFVFATIWAFGGPMSSDGRIDARAVFSNWWRKEFPNFKMSDTLTVFDYFLDAQDFEWKPWSDLVKPFQYDPDEPLSTVTVQTADTVRMTQLMNYFVDNGRSVMLVGTAGTGKTNLIMSKLRTLDSQHTLFRVIAFNARTSSQGLQAVMEQSLEKRTGKTFGPFNRKKLIFFLDDINMPDPDKYGTQECIALLQQHINYGFWYDRIKIILKEIVDLRYVAAMNPKSGTFTILDRVLRHFAVFSTNMPDRLDLIKIYGQILSGHWAKFNYNIRDTLTQTITQATIDLHAAIVKDFLPTAIKFHYQWNMREMFNIFQGMCKSMVKLHNDNKTLIRLWIHECNRTFRDRMPVDDDIARYDDILSKVIKTSFPDMDFAEITQQPLLWAPFYTTKDGDENVYNETDLDTCSNFLTRKLADYNETFARMDLVLFNQAIEHVCRIARITSNPRGNALLVGVGGSGKQSLARLASFLNGQDIFQIMVTSSYGINEFRTDVQGLYQKAGLKNVPYALILTDSQIVSQDMLVYLNDMLSSGNVPDLFNNDERDGIIGSLANEAKSQGLDSSSPDVVWEYFISKVRTNFHIILCFSPVAKEFSAWCRQFPAIATTTVIDWFHRWPEEALKSVARRFLSEIDLGTDEMTGKVADFMANCQEGITAVSEEYIAQEKRYCYTTPKSFLELIDLYKRLLATKRSDLLTNAERLEGGINQIRDASEKVDGLNAILAEKTVAVEKASQETKALMKDVEEKKTIVESQTAIAAEEAAKTNVIVREVEAVEAECQRELAEALPALEAAKNAVAGLKKEDINTLKSYPKPPDDVALVANCVKILISPASAITPVRARTWADAKKMMNNPNQLMDQLLNIDANNMDQANIDAIQMYINDPSFDPELIKTKSSAAAGMCRWAIGLNKYHEERCKVKPKEERLAQQQAKLKARRDELEKVQRKVAELDATFQKLKAESEKAQAEGRRIEAEQQETKDKIDRAERLVRGLSDENKRWSQTIKDLKAAVELQIGNVLLGSAFISYIGPFSKSYRERILNQQWIPAVREAGIPMSEGLDVVMHVLTNEAQVASWNNEGLPADPISTENGAIVTNCSRWPLMIDPQLQGIKWIRTREEKNGLRIIQTSEKKWQSVLENCIEEGLPCLLHGIGENIEPVLENVLGRATYKKGGRQFIKLGAAEVEYNPKFRFFLQTKLGNPRYKPEVNAQTTLINFMVTETGLEDQLLAVVVNQERPDLEEKRVNLLRQMNTFTIELEQCETGLLNELAAATGDILSNVTLIENLETTKKKAREIGISMKQAVITKEEIGESRLTYTPVATRGSLIFFQMDQLCKIDHMYQYSLEAFMTVFNKALAKAPQPEDRKDVNARVELVLKSITETTFAYVSRGLFERHKLIFSSLLCFAILSREGAIDRRQLDFLLRGKKKFGVERPEAVQEWCTEPNWAGIQALAEVEGATPEFNILPHDMSDSNRWKLWAETERPEDEKLPADWKGLSNFQKLLVLRCLRPDRLTAALEDFVAASIGRFFVSDQAVSIDVSFKDSTTKTPLFFILSPGVDPVKAVEDLGRKHGFTGDNGTLSNVSLGQGQEIVADRALERCFANGGWTMLSNIHLVAKWLPSLEQRLDQYAEIYTRMAQIARRKAEKRAARRALLRAEMEPAEEGEVVAEGDENEYGEPKAEEEQEREEEEEFDDDDDDDDDDPDLKMDGPRGHPDFRVFLSAEPSAVIPIGVLQRSVKLTSEPPSGIQANLARAMANFSDEPWEKSAKPTEYRCIMFSMCFFHAVVVERKKFGAQGWNRTYPFNMGDLTTCMEVAANYIEDRPKIPWEDLRYVFGEIMYGGHITDDRDRVLCMAYLQAFIQPECCDGLELVAGFPVPAPMSYSEYLTFIRDSGEVPAESPVLYGLHPNAEINYRTTQAETLFRTINELQPTQQGGADAKSPAELVGETVNEILERLPEPHNLQEFSERLDEDRKPDQHVFYQECERMNVLVDKIRTTLEELNLGLKGELSMTTAMQDLQDQIFMGRVPEAWGAVSFMSQRPLSGWVENFQQRNQQLLDWVPEMQSPKVTNIALFFNPMSFLTAIMQQTSINNSYDLDQMSLVIEVLKKSPDQIETAARDGFHICGLIMEGARWDPSGTIEDSRMKELYPRMPVMTVKSLPLNKIDRRDQYECPLYKTQERGHGYVVGFFLKSKAPARKWVIAGVGLLLDVVE